MMKGTETICFKKIIILIHIGIRKKKIMNMKKYDDKG